MPEHAAAPHVNGAVDPLEDALAARTERAVAREFRNVRAGTALLAARLKAQEEELAAMLDARHVASRRAVARRVVWAVILPFIQGLVLAAVLVAAGWGLTEWATYRLRTSAVALAEVEDRITAAELQLDAIRDESWGVGTAERDDRCFVLLPEDADVDTFIRLDGRRAVELPCLGKEEALND